MAALTFACLAAPLIQPAVAPASTQIESFSVERTTVQAGDHPGLTASFSLASSGSSEIAKDAVLSTPAGLFVNPTATPSCSAADFATRQCSPNSQVGLVTVRAKYEGDADHLLGTAPVFALLPGGEETARFGFDIPTVDLPISIPVTVRTNDDYGLDLGIKDLPQAVPLAAAKLTLWAVPAEPANDSSRFPVGSAGCPGLEDASCNGGATASSSSQLPLLDNPTACSAEFKSSLTVDTYEDPDDLSSRISSGIPSVGCRNLQFTPGLNASLSTTATSTASGLNLSLTTGGDGTLSPTGLAPSAVKTATFVLPSGLTIDPAAAGGSPSCTPTEFQAIGPGGDCPAGSEIGAFTISAVQLGEPLAGSIYFAETETAGTYRLFLGASGNGMTTKFEAPLKPGPEPEQLQLQLSDLPQMPTDEYLLELAPESKLLVTPVKCGKYKVGAILASWSAPTEGFLQQSLLTLDSGPGGGSCPDPGGTVPGVEDSAPAASNTLAPAPILPVGTPPNVRLIGGHQHRTHDRTPSFRFTSDPAGIPLECGLDDQHFRPCTSPLTLKKLHIGAHVFKVRSGSSQASTYRFVVLRPHRGY